MDNPEYYTRGNIETIDFILDKELNFCEGNIVKYICRYKYKGNPLEDLAKARNYIDFLINDYIEKNLGGKDEV